VAVVDYLGDDSLKILRAYKKKDKRIRVYSNLQRYGLASTLNRGVKLSRGQYLAFMDSSGAALKTRLKRQLKYLENNPKVAAVGTQTAVVNSQDKEVEKTDFPSMHEEIYKHLITGSSMKFETIMVDRKRLPKDIFNFKKGMLYPFVYIDVFMKIGQYGQLANLNQRLVQTREIVRTDNPLLRLDKHMHFIKTLLTSTADTEYKPSFKALFTPLLRNLNI
jgi:glycosyltransferase involved in cell wall biosynthesis